MRHGVVDDGFESKLTDAAYNANGGVQGSLEFYTFSGNFDIIGYPRVVAEHTAGEGYK